MPIAKMEYFWSNPAAIAERSFFFHRWLSESQYEQLLRFDFELRLGYQEFIKSAGTARFLWENDTEADVQSIFNELPDVPMELVGDLS
ncbi:hypothetical protein HPT29_018015 [Microvirga terrae]|uniref:Uncharacterized protein n=1 Tax=Microvirga terrae TaxID=2740529 RepID=A0ABY5RNM7_9HYPH|nr:hypothetical protein [Microvirga terrae]UVF18392.1 hypothetical protein HPT29_018015 [Microvirga terrae]